MSLPKKPNEDRTAPRKEIALFLLHVGVPLWFIVAGTWRAVMP
jgi:hypothetical protein